MNTPVSPRNQPGRLALRSGSTFLILSLAAAVAFPWDADLSGGFRLGDIPGDLRKAISLSEAFAHGISVLAIWIAVFCASDPSRRSQIRWAMLLTLLCGLVANGLKSTVVRLRPHSVGQVEVVDSLAEQSGSMTENVAGGNVPENGEDKEAIREAGAVGKEVIKASFWDSRQRSFPSGHSATAWGLAIGLSLVFPRGRIVFGMLAALACVQRLTSGAHFPSDVLVGTAVAFACAAVLLAIPASGRRLCGMQTESASAP